MNIDTSTQVCALIGDPVSHSLSPAIHNAAFEAMGINYIYLAFRVRDCAGAMAGLRSFEQMKGFSVTIPYKMAVCQYLDWIDDIAGRIGSVNTVVKDGSLLRGYNTDGAGAIAALRDAGIDIAGAVVLMLGSGGAARGIAFALLMEEYPPARMAILGIDETQINGLVSDLASHKRAEVRGGLLAEGSLKKEIRDAQILIHCSPVGMWPDTDRSLVPPDLLHSDMAVFDAVYNPLKTRLLKDAEGRGCTIVEGLGMFLQQARHQFKLWTGQEAPIEVMRQAALRHLIRDQAP